MIVPAWVAAVCCACQLLVLYSTFFFDSDPNVEEPILCKHFGRLTFLTVQSNSLLSIFFGASLLSAMVDTPALDAVLLRLFPLAFALGVFLTLAYYALDHFNPESVRRRQRALRKHPYIEYGANIEHGLALPAIALFCTSLSHSAPAASATDVGVFVGGYISFYLGFLHVNKYLTGLWVYPVVDDITSQYGAAGRNVFFAALLSVFLALACLGRTCPCTLT